MTALDPQDLDRAACAARDAADPLAAIKAIQAEMKSVLAARQLQP